MTFSFITALAGVSFLGLLFAAPAAEKNNPDDVPPKL